MTIALKEIFRLKDPNWEIQYFKNHWETKVHDKEKWFLPEEGIRRIAKSGHAYLTDINFSYGHIPRYFDSQMICQLTEVDIVKITRTSMWTTLNGQFIDIMRMGYLISFLFFQS